MPRSFPCLKEVLISQSLSFSLSPCTNTFIFTISFGSLQRVVFWWRRCLEAAKETARQFYLCFSKVAKDSGKDL